jgi:hypothetical protein
VQLFDLLAGPKAIPHKFATWDENFKNHFILLGSCDDIDEAKTAVCVQQRELARKLEALSPDQRKDKVFKFVKKDDKIIKAEILSMPVITDIQILADDVVLMKTAACLQQCEFQQPLMSEDGQLILPDDDSLSRPGSVFSSRHSSSQLSQQPSPRRPNVDKQIYQEAASIIRVEMRKKDDLVSLCGGPTYVNYLPKHESIGMLITNSPAFIS